MAGINRRLGLTDEVVTSALGVLETVLAGPTPRTRRELRVAFDAAGLPTAVQHLAHLVMIAEVRAMRLLRATTRHRAHLRARRRDGACRRRRTCSPVTTPAAS